MSYELEARSYGPVIPVQEQRVSTQAAELVEAAAQAVIPNKTQQEPRSER